MTQSLAQKRAQHALQQIEALNARGDYGKYVSYVKALPASILMSGLGQALAMEKAGSNKNSEDVSKGHGALFEHMEAWLCNANGNGWSNGPYSGDLLSAIVNGTEEKYIRAQSEAMAYLEWLKKFAVALLDDPTETPASADEEAAS